MARIIIKNARLSYANVWEPKSINGSDPKYSTAILIDKSDVETVKEIEQAIKAAAKEGKERFGSKWKPSKLPLRDGDTEDLGPEYEGKFFLNANSKTQPGIVDRKRREITDETEVYSGVFANVSVSFYPFNASGNQGVAAGLGNIQKVKDGDALDGRISAEDEFSVLDDEDDDTGFGGLLD